MAIPVALQNFKAAGIYKVVYDKSTILNQDTNILRLVVGYSEKGPFNCPTYVTSVSDFKAIYGDISKKLEKRGDYFHRMAIQCLATSPILCLNLKRFQTETVNAVGITLPAADEIRPASSPELTVRSVLVEDIYNTSRFWTLDATKLNEIKDTAARPLDGYIKISATNEITTSASFFIRKANGNKVNAYNVTVNDWYKDAGEDVPEYLQDYLDAQISDFFAEIYIFKGQFTKKVVNASESLMRYFDIKGDNVYLKPSVEDAYGDAVDTLDALYDCPVSGAMSHYVGCLIPYFKNKIGQYVSLDILMNQDVDTNNMMMAFDVDGLDDGEYCIDLSCSNNQAQAEKAYETGFTSILGNINSPVSIYTYKSTFDDAGSGSSSLNGVYGDSFSNIPFEAAAKQISDDDDCNYAGSWVVKVTEDIASIISERDMFFGKDGSLTKALASGLAGNILLHVADPDADDSYNTLPDEETIESLGITASDYIVVLDAEPKEMSGFYVRCEDSCNEEIGTMAPVYLEGYTYQNAKPESTSMLHKLNWQNLQLSALSDYKGLRTGLMNKADIDFRYVVDTFETYVDSGAKTVLAGLAKDKQSAFAILNFPSVQTFVKCPYASYTDNKGIFNPQYVVDGYNKKKAHSKGFSLPADVDGASFCAFYTPLKFSDGYVDAIVPSAGLVSNLYINKYLSRHPYDIVAGPNYGSITASGLVGPDYNYSMDELQIIEPFGVNCMIYRPSFGTFINANQTAKQTPKSALSSVNVRELVIYLQDEIEKLLQAWQWEFNNPTNRQKIKDKADVICAQVQANGGIQDFLNVMDESNNTPDVIDNEMAILSTHIEPGRGMGKMVHELTLYRTGQMRSTILE